MHLHRCFFITCSLAVLILGLVVSQTAVAKPVSARRNFIIIFTDDQGYQDLGCFGSSNIKTPQIDRLAAEGIKFTAFYSAAAVCSPARAALMTGCYPKRVGVPKVYFPWSKEGLNPSEFTIADMAKQAGYATACIGKWHLGHHPEFLPTGNGFDYYFGVPYSNDMKSTSHSEGASPKALDKAWRLHKEANRWWNVPLMRNQEVIEQPVDQTQLTERYTEEAIQFIEKNREKPFLLYLAHSMPHVPLFVSQDRFDPDPKKAYQLTIEHIDSSAGRIVAALKKYKLDRNTVVVFTSDNGPWLTKAHHGGSAKPLTLGKFSFYEGGMRVPCVMWAPGLIPAGRTTSEIASTIDLLPTFAAIAGVELPADRIVDGKNILPLMKGGPEARSPHKAIYYYTGNTLKAIRTARWKLSHLHEKEPAMRLFDMTTVTGEKKILKKSKHADTVQELLTGAREFDKQLSANIRPAGLHTATKK